MLNDLKSSKPNEFVQQMHYEKHLPVPLQQHCHTDPRKLFDFSSKDGLYKRTNFQLAAKQAFEMRDFKALYNIVIKGFELDDKNLSKILYEVISQIKLN